MRWKRAMDRALYGEHGFFRRAGAGPARHFRTSAHVSARFAEVIADVTVLVQRALGHPLRLDVVDVGAGRGELLVNLLDVLPSGLVDRVRMTAVEVAARPDGLPERIGWTDELPSRVHGLLLATEWLDNIPLEIVEVDPDGVARYVGVEAAGAESLYEPVAGADADWLTRWWPLSGAPPGTRAEIGLPRDEAWASAVRSVERGLALTIDYGHLAGARPRFGSLRAYRSGREVDPIPDGERDLTVEVALDAVAEAGSRAVGVPSLLLSQRDALRALGADGRRPPIALASTDPAGYVRALARASTVTELIDPAGLGGHTWLWQPVGTRNLGLDL